MRNPGCTRRRTGWSRSWSRPRAGERYAQRKWLSEAPNGWIKACPRMVPSGGGPGIPAVQLAGSGQGAGGMGLGVPGIEPQAVATASGGVRAPARQWDMARIVPIGGLAGLSGPSRVPCLPLRTCGVPALVSIPASSPARPSAHVLEPPFYGADSWQDETRKSASVAARFEPGAFQPSPNLRA